MKTLKKLTLGLLAAGVMTSSALAYTPSAQVVHVAGSTAFRTATSIAIIDALEKAAPSTGVGTPTTASTTNVYAAYVTSGNNVTNDSETIFANGHIDGSTGTQATVIVECNWTGSLTGCVDLVGGKSQTAFLDETNSNVQSALNQPAALITAPGYGNGYNITASGVTKSTGDTIQLAMSDSNKATVAKELATANLSGSIGSYTSSGLLAAGVLGNLKDAGTSSYAGKAGTVGVVPFQWFLGNYTVAPTYVPTNITQQQAAALFGNGDLPQASFTGTNNGTSDQTTTFYLVGRNEDSGTRIGALAESQFGVTGNPTQYVLGDDKTSLTGSWSIAILGGTATGGESTSNCVTPFPANATLQYEPQVYWPYAGHSGYNSGTNVRTALALSNNGTDVVPYLNGDPGTTNAYFIGYLGLTDGNAVIPSVTALSYNGVAYSNHAVANGSYTFWTFEHAYYNSAASPAPSTLQTNIVNLIADLIYYRDADAIYSSGSVSYAEPTLGSGVYTESSTPGKSPGNAGLLFDAGFTATRGLEGTPVISGF